LPARRSLGEVGESPELRSDLDTHDWILIFGAAIFGAILGSFLNAITFRYNTSASLWKAMQGRSRCMRCAHTLGALDLVPIFSYVYLGGRCRYCGSHVSIQYPLVEIAAAVLSVEIYLQFPNPFLYALWFLIWLTVLFLVVYDWRHMILPLPALGLLGILGFVSLFVSGTAMWEIVSPPLPQFLAGPLYSVLLLSLPLVSRGRWMGWGDGIFMLPLGWMLGLAGGLTALVLSFWIGALVGTLLIALRTSGISLKSEIPFGPFLALGAALVFFTHFNLLTLFRIY
jgi:prepilin signal peptidase PulO-like enzyme (type II secretory pathway)